MIRKYPKNRLAIILSITLIFTCLLFALNLITTNGIVNPVGVGLIKPASQAIRFESAERHENGVLEPVVEQRQQHDLIINKHISPPVVQTLFRGDIPEKLNPDPLIGGFPAENRLSIQTNGHSNGIHENEIAINSAVGAPMAAGASSSSHVQHYGQFKNPNAKLKIPYKLIHIDLKGAPPKLKYLKSLFKTISEAGGNGILLEYEDMFPFSGALNGTAHGAHFTEAQIKDLLTAAAANNLEVIPLVQTFGHLEFILKLSKFRPLREEDEFPQEICPSNEVAWNLVTHIIDQVVALHKAFKPRYIHIGCDEVYHIGECDRCKGKEVKKLFLDHVMRVAKYVKKKYGLSSIIWDDMLRKFYVEELVKSDIGSHVELMIWDYTEDVDRLLPPYLWPMYGQVFPNIWAASAYKGAFGETLYKVNIQRHALNHLSWLSILGREQRFIKNLRGVAVTGWSRYDHFSVLCELLPVAVPSLILSLQLLIYQNLEQASKELFKLLKCDGGSSLTRFDDCVWDGSDLSSTMGTLQFYQEQTTTLIKTHRLDKGWLTAYNVKHNYSSPFRLIDPIQSATQYVMSLKNYESSVRTTLKKYYENHVINEWIEEKIGSLIDDLNNLIKDGEGLSSRRVWPHRPLKLLK